MDEVAYHLTSPVAAELRKYLMVHPILGGLHHRNRLASTASKVLIHSFRKRTLRNECSEVSFGELVSNVDHADFDVAFSKTGFSTLALASHEALRVLRHNVIQDVILIGSVRNDSGTYQVEVTAVRVSDGTVLVSHRAVFQPTPVLDSLTKPFPPPNGSSRLSARR